MNASEAKETALAMAKVQDGYAKKATDLGLKLIHEANAKAQREVAKTLQSLQEANHRQAHCLHLTARALGPDYSAAIDALPKAAQHVSAQLAAARAEIARLREALIVERQRWWSPEYPNQPKPTLAVWFTSEPEDGMSGFDNEADRDEFNAGGDGPFLRRVTGNEYPQMPFRAALPGETPSEYERKVAQMKEDFPNGI